MPQHLIPDLLQVDVLLVRVLLALLQERSLRLRQSDDVLLRALRQVIIQLLHSARIVESHLGLLHHQVLEPRLGNERERGLQEKLAVESEHEFYFQLEWHFAVAILIALPGGLVVLPVAGLVPLESCAPCVCLCVGEVGLPLVVHLPQRLDLFMLLRIELLPDLQKKVLELVQDVPLRLGHRYERIVGSDVIADDASMVGSETNMLSAEYLLLS